MRAARDPLRPDRGATGDWNLSYRSGGVNQEGSKARLVANQACIGLPDEGMGSVKGEPCSLDPGLADIHAKDVNRGNCVVNDKGGGRCSPASIGQDDSTKAIGLLSGAAAAHANPSHLLPLEQSGLTYGVGRQHCGMRETPIEHLDRQ